MELIRWGSGSVAFELRSSDNEVVQAARDVLGRWIPSDSATLEGSWEIHRNGDTIVIEPEPISPHETGVPEIRSAEQAVTVVEYAAIWEIVRSCHHILGFHSALLSRDGRGVAIVGPSEAGKSTLSTALWQAGWTFLCDDLTMVVDGRATAGPRRVSLRDGSRTLVGDDLWKSVEGTPGYQRTMTGCLFHPVADRAVGNEVDLAAVIFLKRNGATETSGPNRLTPADAAIALLPYTNLVQALPFPDALAPIARLMSVVPAWDLPRAPLPEMIDSVERLTGISSD